MARIPRRLAGIGASDLSDNAKFDSYVGPAREITVDPVRGIIALHDGVTPGGQQFLKGGGGDIGINPIPKSFEGIAGDNKTYALDEAPHTAGNVFVYVGGIRQRPLTDYTVNGLNLTILSNPDGLEVDTILIAGPFALTTLQGKVAADFATAAQGEKADFVDVEIQRVYAEFLKNSSVMSPLHDFNNQGTAGLRVRLSTPAPLADRVAQGLTFVPQTGEWYYILGTGTDWVARTNTIVRANSLGEVIDYSADTLLTLGHGQGLNHLYYNDVLTFITQNTEGDGMTAFTYTNGTTQALGNIREYKLTTAGSYRYTTIGLSANKRSIVASYKDQDDGEQYVRIFDAVSLLSGPTGDRSSEYLYQICLSDNPDYDWSAANNQHQQGVTMDDAHVYSLNGYWQIDVPKYLYAFRLSDGVLALKKLVDSGKSYAASAGTGTTYEPEDLEWIETNGKPCLWMGMRTGGGPGNVNWAQPINDTFGALAVNGDHSPGGVGLMFSGGPHDIVYRGALMAGTLGGDTNPAVITNRFGWNGSGRYWTADRVTASGEQFPDIGPNTAIIGASMNYWGAFSANRNGISLELNRLITDGQVAAWRRDGVTVGSISVTGTATTYNTSSDATLKDDDGEMPFEEARAILDLIRLHNFRWKSTGKEDHGVFAQELYEIYPTAVSVGGWFREAGEEKVMVPCSEEDDGAFYVPWSVDYSKLIPVITRCEQENMRRVDALEARIEAIEMK